MAYVFVALHCGNTMLHICFCFFVQFTGNKGAKGHPGEPGVKGRCVSVPGSAGLPGPKGSDGIPGLCDFNSELHNKCKR